MKNLFSLILVALLLNSCSNSNSANNADANSKVVEPVANQNVSKTGPAFESISADIMKNLFDKCQLIDYIFHDLPFSMNQSEQSGIRSTISHVSTSPLEYIPTGCKPIARQFFQIDGEIVVEADVYFSDNCKFFVFFEDGKAKYANKMSPSGIEFYTSIIKKALDARKNAVSGQ